MAFAVGGGSAFRRWPALRAREARSRVRGARRPRQNRPSAWLWRRSARKTLRRATVQPGQIQAFEQTPLFVKLPAYVQKLHADIGDRVEQNRPLADLWIPELEDDLARRRPRWPTPRRAWSRRRRLSSLRGSRRHRRGRRPRGPGGHHPRPRAVRVAEVGVCPNRRIGRQPQRRSRLVDENRIRTARPSEAARVEAEAKVASAEAILAERQEGVEKAKADLAVAHANVASAKADSARARSLLQYTQVRMPYAG